MMFKGYRISPFLPILAFGAVGNLVMFIFAQNLFNIIVFGFLGWVISKDWDTMVEKVIVRDDDEKPNFEDFRIDK
jgi:hypothetical protein